MDVYDNFFINKRELLEEVFNTIKDNEPSKHTNDYIDGWIEAWSIVYDVINNQSTVDINDIIAKLNQTKGMCGHFCCKNVTDEVVSFIKNEKQCWRTDR